MRRAVLVACAALVDFVAGDPPSWPHPVTALAAGTRALELQLRRFERSETAAGGALAFAVVGAAAAAGRAIERAPALVRVALAASTLAAGSLLDHAAEVRDALESCDLARSRAALAKIVGRDTAALDEPAIARAAIESLGESLCDGVVAPLLALGAFGIGGAFAYKAINTLDSLIGHIEPPYTHFGRVAARLDDAANLVPARLTAVFVAAAATWCGADGGGALRVARRDGRRHRSPNAGFGEAAMAGALRVRLGGAASYDGVPYDAPIIGAEFRACRAADVRDAMRLTWYASLFAYASVTIVAALRA